MDDAAIIRFESKIDKLSSPLGCWQWIAGLTSSGYPDFWLNGKSIAGHRAAYQHFVGPIPSGLVLDHLCRNRSCVNPAHLQAVTQAENARRGNTGIRQAQWAKCTCPCYCGARK